MRELIKKWRWIEICLPTLLGVFLWGFLTYVVYDGAKGYSIADLAEQYLIRRTLVKQTPEGVDPEVTHVTLKVDTKPDRRWFEDFADTLQGLKAKSSLIIVTLPQRPPSWWLEEVQAIDQLYLVVPQEEIDREKEEARVKFAQDCAASASLACPYERDDSSILHLLVETYWPNGPPRFHTSRNLPFEGLSFLLNLKRVVPQSLEKPLEEWTPSGSSLISIGLIQGDSQVMFDPHLPYHEFIAQLATMLKNKHSVAIPPRVITYTLLVLLCGVILSLLWRIGSTPALAIFVIYSILYPYANDLGVDWFHVYIPMFDFIYVGFITFLGATYWRLSWQSYQRWRLHAKAQALSNVRELKGNFISLVSHDLNTPVAKMLGLTEIIQAKESSAQSLFRMKEDLAFVRKKIARLQLCIRAVLMTARIEGDSLHEGSISLQALVWEIEDRVGSVLATLGVPSEFLVDENDDEEKLTPFFIDVRLICYLLAAIIALFDEVQSQKIQVFMRFRFVDSNEGGGGELSCQFFSPSPFSFRAQKLIGFIDSSNCSNIEQRGFVEQSLMRLIHIFKDEWQASFSFTDESQGSKICLRIPVRL